MFCKNYKKVTTSLVIFITMFAEITSVKADETGFKFGGFVKLSAAVTTKGLNGIDDALGLYNADLLFADDQKGSRFGISAKETRLHVNYSKNDTSVGRINAYIEGNFGVDGNGDANTIEAYGSSNHRFVLRHAYIEVGDFLIGQTFSTFLDLISAPQVIDFGGNAASVFARQPQVRFTKKMGLFTIRLAAENPTSNLGYNLITDDQRIPDFVGRVDFDGNLGHLSVAGIIRELRIDNGEFEAHKLTGGIAITVSKEIVKNKLSTMAQYIRGGIGHYGSFSAFSDGIILVDAAGKMFIDPLNFHGFTGSVTLNWTDDISTTIVGSYTKNLDPGQNTMTLGSGHSIENVKSFHANLYYNVTEDLLFAFEYKKLIGELSDETEPNIDRFQVSAVFTF